MPRIVLGVTSYNGAERLSWLLRSLALRTLRTHDFAVVVVDDGSPRVQATRAAVEPFKSELPLHFLEHGKNRGISAGWNTAVRALDAEIAVLLNDDVILPSGDWLGAMVLPLDECPGVGGVGVNWHAFLPEDVPALLASPESDQAVTPRDCVSKQHAPERRGHEDHGPGRVMCPGGQLFAFRRADFDAIGGFDEGMLSFFEESLFGSLMARDRKKIGVQLNFPMCWHLWSATFKQNPELHAGARMAASRRRYIERMQVPPAFHGDKPGPFDYVNPTYLGALPPVPVRYRKRDGSVGEIVL